MTQAESALRPRSRDTPRPPGSWTPRVGAWESWTPRSPRPGGSSRPRTPRPRRSSCPALLELDPRHPAAAELSARLNTVFRSQADAAAASCRAPRGTRRAPAERPSSREFRDADRGGRTGPRSSWRGEEFADATRTFLEARDGYDRAGRAARERQAAARRRRPHRFRPTRRRPPRREPPRSAPAPRTAAATRDATAGPAPRPATTGAHRRPRRRWSRPGASSRGSTTVTTPSAGRAGRLRVGRRDHPEAPHLRGQDGVRGAARRGAAGRALRGAGAPRERGPPGGPRRRDRDHHRRRRRPLDVPPPGCSSPRCPPGGGPWWPSTRRCGPRRSPGASIAEAAVEGDERVRSRLKVGVKRRSDMALEISERARRMPASPIRKLAPLADAAKGRGVHVHHLNIGQPDLETPAVMRSRLASRPGGARLHPVGRDRRVRGVAAGVLPRPRHRPRRRGDRGHHRRERGDPLRPHRLRRARGTRRWSSSPSTRTTRPSRRWPGCASFPCGRGARTASTCLPSRSGRNALTPRTRLVLLCNPNNPTGTVYRREEVEAVAGFCRDNGLFLVSDEVYRELAFDGAKATSALDIPGTEDLAIVVDSLSKRYSACGIRLGCLVTRNRDGGGTRACGWRRGGCRRPGWPSWSPSGPPSSGPSTREGMVEEYQSRRDVLFEGLSRIPGVFLRKPEGAFYLVARLPVEDSEDFAAWLLSDFDLDGATVMVAPAPGFYATPGLGLDEVRIAYVLKRQDLEGLGADPRPRAAGVPRRARPGPDRGNGRSGGALRAVGTHPHLGPAAARRRSRCWAGAWPSPPTRRSQHGRERLLAGSPAAAEAAFVRASRWPATAGPAAAGRALALAATGRLPEESPSLADLAGSRPVAVIDAALERGDLGRGEGHRRASRPRRAPPGPALRGGGGPRAGGRRGGPPPRRREPGSPAMPRGGPARRRGPGGAGRRGLAPSCGTVGGALVGWLDDEGRLILADGVDPLLLPPFGRRRHGGAGAARTRRTSRLSGFPPTSVAAAARTGGLRLTLDLDLARLALDSLGRWRGTIVLLEPRTGAILAAVSDPRTDRPGGPGRLHPASRAGLDLQDHHRRRRVPDGIDAHDAISRMTCKGRRALRRTAPLVLVEGGGPGRARPRPGHQLQHRLRHPGNPRRAATGSWTSCAAGDSTPRREAMMGAAGRRPHPAAHAPADRGPVRGTHRLGHHPASRRAPRDGRGQRGDHAGTPGGGRRLRPGGGGRPGGGAATAAGGHRATDGPAPAAGHAGGGPLRDRHRAGSSGLPDRDEDRHRRRVPQGLPRELHRHRAHARRRASPSASGSPTGPTPGR